MTEPRMAYFHAMTSEQKCEAVRALAREGYSDHGIAHATQLAVEQIRQLLAEGAQQHDRRAQ